jgi:hypothetical protein
MNGCAIGAANPRGNHAVPVGVKPTIEFARPQQLGAELTCDWQLNWQVTRSPPSPDLS